MADADVNSNTNSNNSSLLDAGMGSLALLGGLFQASAASAVGSYQKSAYDNNASLALMQADDAIRRGDQEANYHMQRVGSLVGQQKASFAAQGIVTSNGSALDTQAQTYSLGYDDALRIKNNAYRQAFGYRIQAIDDTTKGIFAQTAADAHAGSYVGDAIIKGGQYFSDALKRGKTPEVPNGQDSVNNAQPLRTYRLNNDNNSWNLNGNASVNDLWSSGFASISSRSRGG